ncbi:hypothetical protein L914_19773 [Phytophthora nicotianae]|uniref:Uncharacterized protein n=1 Tax=Phytophthora nicotianae TaxID=4792 RepID=W2M9A0_PHYNI|nr:hypothetical protein L914_19773 [Phytophthora nicotianae]
MWRVELERRENEEREVDKHASKCKVDSVKSAKNVENTDTVESVGSTENAEGVDIIAISEENFDDWNGTTFSFSKTRWMSQAGS